MADKQSREFIGQVRNEGEPTEVYVGPKRNPLTIEVEVDVSEAITGLKALQREAKEATKALRELEVAQRDTNQPLVVSPLTVGIDVPSHIKKYRQGSTTWTKTGGKDLDVWFSELSTKQLVEELSKRPGVETADIEARGIDASAITINWQEVPTE